MNRFDKIQNIAGAALFGAIGLAALIAAVFAGATHQFVMAAICALMVAVFVAEIVKEERKAKTRKSIKL